MFGPGIFVMFQFRIGWQAFARWNRSMCIVYKQCVCTCTTLCMKLICSHFKHSLSVCAVHFFILSSPLVRSAIDLLGITRIYRFEWLKLYAIRHHIGHTVRMCVSVSVLCIWQSLIHLICNVWYDVRTDPLTYLFNFNLAFGQAYQIICRIAAVAVVAVVVICVSAYYDWWIYLNLCTVWHCKLHTTRFKYLP